MTRKRKNEPGQIEQSGALEDIRMIDTSGYKGNPMTERLLADQIAEQKEKIKNLEDSLSQKNQRVSLLEIKVAKYEERYDSVNMRSWIGTLIAVFIGYSVSLISREESSLNKVGFLFTFALIALFVLTCVLPTRRRKHEEQP